MRRIALIDRACLMDIATHNQEIAENRRHWREKPLLRQAYRDFYQRLASHFLRDLPGLDVEMGSGLGAIKEVLPDCLATDIFPNEWIDRVENAYGTSFAAGEVRNLILFDVFHHLEYPGTALAELARVIRPGGRLLIFEPGMGILGQLVYGCCHHEPLGLSSPIVWLAPPGWQPAEHRYFAAQARAHRVFCRPGWADQLTPAWRTLRVEKMAAFSYVGTGGFRGPQLYPKAFRRLLLLADRLGGLIPFLFCTRLLIVLERK